MRDDGPTIAELFAAAAKRGVVVKGLLWRSHLDKLAYSEEENRNLGDDDRGGRRRGAARPAGPARRLAPPEARGAAASRTPRSATSRSPAASTCATAAATTPTTTAIRSRWPWPTAYGQEPALARRAAGAARPGGRRARPDLPGALDATRRRWTSTARSPRCSDKLRHADLHAGHAAAAAARPAAVRPAGRPGAAHLPGDAAAVRLRPAAASAPSPAATPRRSSGPAG